MIGAVRASGKWSVLVLDNVTTQIMTNVCGVADLLDYGVSRELILWTEKRLKIRSEPT